MIGKFEKYSSSYYISSSPNSTFQTSSAINEDRLAIGCSNGDIIVVKFEYDEHLEHLISENSVISRIFSSFSTK